MCTEEDIPDSLHFDSHTSIKAQNEIPYIVPKWKKDLQLQITHYYESQRLEIQIMIVFPNVSKYQHPFPQESLRL